MGIAEFVLGVFGLYLAVGVVVAIAFITAGVSRVDPAAKGAPLGFRLLILPGAAALWPVMLAKWFGGRCRGGEHAA